MKNLEGFKSCKFVPITNKSGSTLVTTSSLCVVEHVQVVGFGSVEEDLTVTCDVNNPAKDVMFLANVKPFKGTSFKILTDGDKYYPVSGKTRLKVNYDVILSVGAFSEIDQLIVLESIRQFSEQFD